jgi:hypothetical protein
MLPTLATVDQLETRLAQPVPDEDQALALLNYASARIRGWTGKTSLTDVGDLVDPLPDGVSQVGVEMVFRAVTNPTGATQDTTGPFSVSFGPDAAQRIYLSKSDKTILRSRPGLGTISTTRGDVETGTVWVPTTDPFADPVPLLADPPY